MIPIDLGKNLNGVSVYMQEKETQFIIKGLDYIEGYLEGVGRSARFLAYFGYSLDINCAESALKKLKVP
jgi:hypothetical protein